MATNAVTKARRKVGIPLATAARNAGLGQQTLHNLEQSEGATRLTDPADARLSTILNLCAVYYPHLQLDDLVPGTPFKLVPIDGPAGKRLRRNVGKSLD